MPRWALLVVVINFIWAEASPLGPAISNHV